MRCWLYCIAWCTIFIFLNACHAPAPPQTVASTQLQADTTATSITWKQIQNSGWQGKTVQIEGYVQTPSMFYTSGNRIPFDIYPRPGQFYGEHLAIYTPIGNTPNTMANLNDKYSAADIQITGHNGQPIRVGDKVRIVGKVPEYGDFTSLDLLKVEKLPYAGVTYANLSAIELTKQNVRDSTLDNQLVYIDGTLEVPTFVYIKNDVGVDIKHNKTGENITGYLMIGDGPNRIANLPDHYKSSDIKIFDNRGKLLNKHQKVRIYGVWNYNDLHISDTPGMLYIEEIEVL